jgi:hypothetical protein
LGAKNRSEYKISLKENVSFIDSPFEGGQGDVKFKVDEVEKSLRGLKGL